MQHISVRNSLLLGLALLVFIPNHVHGWSPPISIDGMQSGAGIGLVGTEGVSEAERQEQLLSRRIELMLPLRSVFVNYWLARSLIPDDPNINGLMRLMPRTMIENRLSIRFIRSLKIKNPVNILNWGYRTAYLENNYNYVDWPIDRAESFPVYLRTQGVNMIWLTGGLKIRLENEEGLQSFLENAEEYGFTRLEIPGTPGSLLVAKSLEPSLFSAISPGQ